MKNLKIFYPGFKWMISTVALVYAGGYMIYEKSYIIGGIMLLFALLQAFEGIKNGVKN